VEPHLGGCTTDAAVHLGDRDLASRLAFDLVEQSQWNPRREREHAVRIVPLLSPLAGGFVPEAHGASK